MADVIFVCVREDVDRAEALAEMFISGGCTVHEGAFNNAALCLAGAAVVVWSKLAMKSRDFLAAAESAIAEGKAVFACFSEAPSSVSDIPNFDLSSWNGEANSEHLNPLFFTVDRLAALNRDDLAANDSEGMPMAEGWTAELPSTPISSPRLNLAPARVLALDAGEKVSA
jgi:hypothetical protein